MVEMRKVKGEKGRESPKSKNCKQHGISSLMLSELSDPKVDLKD